MKTFTDGLMYGLRGNVLGALVSKTHNSVRKMKKQMVSIFLEFFFFLMGIVFLLVGVILLLSRYLAIEYVLMLTGLIILNVVLLLRKSR